MAMDEILEGTSLTGRQAAIIFFVFLSLIIIAGLLLVTFSDFFRNLVASADVTRVRIGTLGLVLARSSAGLQCGRSQQPP